MAKTQLDADLLNVTAGIALGRATPMTGSNLDIYGSAPVLSLSSGTAAIGADIGTIKMYSDSGSSGQARWAGIKALVPTGAAGIDATALSFWTNSGGVAVAERMRINPNGDLQVGPSTGTYHAISKAGAEAATVLLIGSTQAGYAYFQAINNNAANSASTGLYIGKNSTTSRSINAAGTINASGADYAEYMTKADTCGTIAKGQIVGVNANGKLTDKWAESVSFLIKSSDPSYVGGDVWGSEEALGMPRPVEPAPEHPAYAGSADPGPAPSAPNAPSPLPEDADTEQQLAHDQAQADYAAAMEQYQAQLSDWQAALDTYEQDQAAYADAIAAAKVKYDAALQAYQQDLDHFNATLEAARQKVDRMAYCGQVPVNVTGATPGEYIVPAQDGDGITGQLVDDAAITFEQYRRAVGVVQNILPDGRANVRVKPV